MPLTVAGIARLRKKKEQLKAKQFMTSDVAYTGKKKKKKKIDKRKGTKTKIKKRYYT